MIYYKMIELINRQSCTESVPTNTLVHTIGYMVTTKRINFSFHELRLKENERLSIKRKGTY